MSKKLNLAGQRFNRLEVIKATDKHDNKGRIFWLCICDCGNIVKVRSDNLNNENTRSCGCLQKEVAGMQKGKDNPCYKHGEAIINACHCSRLYSTWKNMKTRCYNSNNRAYRWYGNKGISICSAWRNNYIIFRKWALSNGYKDDLVIDRKNNKGNYEPSNCQFLTQSENLKRR